MYVTSVVAPFLGVNCYIVAAADPGSGHAPAPCVLVDAGLDAGEPLAARLRELGLDPVAILLTHGHPDHVLGLPDLQRRWRIPAYLAAEDEWWLADPAGSLGPEMSAMLEPVLRGREWARPAVSGPDFDPSGIRVAGLEIRAISAPGHTEGSTLWQISTPGGPDSAGGPVHVFTGDVLFASGVGRTDLAGGDQTVMDRTLATVIPALPPAAAVHPGHGPSSTVARELATNPFLAGR